MDAWCVAPELRLINCKYFKISVKTGKINISDGRLTAGQAAEKVTQYIIMRLFFRPCLLLVFTIEDVEMSGQGLSADFYRSFYLLPKTKIKLGYMEIIVLF